MVSFAGMKMSAAKMAKAAAEVALEEIIFEGIDDERKKTIIAHIEKGMKKRLTAELIPVIEKELNNDNFLRGKAVGREEVEKEVKFRAPSAQEIGDFENYVHEIEVDCFAQSVIASNEADNIAAELKRATTRHRLVTGSIPILATLIGCGAAFWAVWPLVIYSFIGGVCTLIHLEVGFRKEKFELEEKIKRAREVSNEFRLLVERAKLYRMVRAKNSRTSSELGNYLTSIINDKTDADMRHQPRIDVIDEARQTARVRIATDTVQAGDFDARLAERLAEAEDEAEEAKSRA